MKCGRICVATTRGNVHDGRDKVFISGGGIVDGFVNGDPNVISRKRLRGNGDFACFCINGFGELINTVALVAHEDDFPVGFSLAGIGVCAVADFSIHNAPTTVGVKFFAVAALTGEKGFGRVVGPNFGEKSADVTLGEKNFLSVCFHHHGVLGCFFHVSGGRPTVTVPHPRPFALKNAGVFAPLLPAIGQHGPGSGEVTKKARRLFNVEPTRFLRF